ncbi:MULTISPECIES: TonB-dependent siderophore receptor [Methylobacterium]|uniref:TonB-dependent receptor BfrD n=6 Tax=Bacteria TaxID=2 RepID=A0ABQ4SXR8_9HYPH|nr:MULTISPECIES: TonB-dependent siderophore receptor [Methylobacterium]PIU08086.1 MAG: TonB-dependent siderophore receptor [Methylobacterium sp. CG09_land_8_20_14_0_10_71_15]PIU15541.1 MAG: TonB-dependent siderophore receptor [Methylobacterium sp. CG08_land_8_20_14_0_20_71_15]GBU19448.1 catecholate siderophore receptor [Methylobacterium sp.]GJE07672.1 putative TonB-dependent receptor BfrD [Methylobacterium jeotgali]
MNQAIETRLAGCLLAGTFLTAPSQVHAQPAPIPVVSAQAVTLDQLAVEGSPATGPQGGVTVGYLTKQTRSATKTNTPLLDTPQSVTVVTREQFTDQNFQNLTDQLRYVPGFIPAQGEGNRDQAIIRGQSTSADFFVNGVRDDVQYYRDLYNVDRVEVLKGPDSLIFGRGGGGGVINRVLKEADGLRVREVTAGGGQFGDKRLTFDVGDRISDSAFFRLNGLFEDSGTYRQFGELTRYGFNPTMTFLLGPQTTLKLSYEYFHDDRFPDRGIPSQFGRAYNYRNNIRTFFGSPDVNFTKVDANIATAILDHRFDSGVELHSQFRFADYDRFYRNTLPGSAVNAAGTAVTITGYRNETDRTNYFNQNDFTYKFLTGDIKHTLLGGFELGYQEGLVFRESAFFNGVASSVVVNPLAPLTRVPVVFRNNGTTDASARYDLGLAAVYLQDQIDLNPYVQIVGGLRYDHFDFASTDRRTLVTNARVDDLVSPRAGLVIKPLQNLAFYGSYSVSYLPSSGDQIGTLTPGLIIAQPERFQNLEVGAKYDVTPTFQLTAAGYTLDRTNQRLPDPNRAGFFILSGKTNAQGFELGANGYLTEWWQIAGGYAYTDARIESATSAVIVAGNKVGLVPFNSVSLWNKFAVTPEFSIGIGYIYQTHTFASSDDTVRLPGYNRFDLGLFYQINESTRAQVNIENVLDRRYIYTSDNNNNLTPGAPRTVRAQVIVRF